MATPIYVNIGSCNGLLPDVTKLLLEPVLTSHHRSCEIHKRAISIKFRDQWVNDFDDDLHPSHQNTYGRYGLWPHKGTRVPGHPLWYSPGVGVTKSFFSVPLFSHFFRMIKTVVTCKISSLYLAGVTAAELRRHLANMNMIESIWPILLLNQNFP